MARLWGILRKKQRMIRDEVVETEGSDEMATHEAVDRLCYIFDIARPVWLPKHTKELDKFGRTHFNSDHFMEEIAFDRFEIEFIRDKSRSSDPRNDFGGNV